MIIIYTLAFLGDTGSGKTSLWSRFGFRVFQDRYVSTSGVGFILKTVDLDNKQIKLRVLDTSGQDRFGGLSSRYYRPCDGFFVVYDVTNKESFENVNKWLEDIKEHAPENVSVILVGTKCDLVSQKVVDYRTAREFAEEKGILFVETCAKENVNVEQAFMMLTAHVKTRKGKKTK